MNTHELYELASMDALGLLDDQERAEFERAFRAAPPAVQADVRRQQLRAADMDDLLPRVDPPAGLRARVVEAVRQAISAVRPAPIAAPEHTGVVAKLYGSMPMWRAACIGFATASIVLSMFFVWVARENKRMSLLWDQNLIMAEFQGALGTRGVEILSRVSETVAFAPAALDVSVDGVEARLLLDPESGEAILICKGLREFENRNYRLVIRDADGETMMREFPSNGGTIAETVDNVDAESVGRLAIVGPLDEFGREGVILRVSDI